MIEIKNIHKEFDLTFPAYILCYDASYSLRMTHIKCQKLFREYQFIKKKVKFVPTFAFRKQSK